MTDREKCALGAYALSGACTGAAGFLVALPTGFAALAVWLFVTALLLGWGGK